MPELREVCFRREWLLKGKEMEMKMEDTDGRLQIT